MNEKKDEFLKQRTNEILKHLFENDDNTKNSSAENRFTFALLSITLFLGAEIVKCLLRKNFTISKRGLVVVIASFLCLCAIAITSLGFTLDSDREKELNVYLLAANIIIAVTFLTAGIYVFARGLQQYRATQANRPGLTSEGFDAVLSFLKKDRWWSETRIQYVAEPLLFLGVGFAILFISPIAGIAMMACAISIWGYALFKIFLFPETMFETVDKLNSRNNDNSYYEIK